MKHIALVLLLVGCSKSDSGNRKAESAPPPKLAGACDRMKTDGICAEYWVTDVAMAKEHCAGYSGTWTESCPTGGALTRCVQGAKTVFETHNLFYGPIWKPESVDAMCKAPDEKRPI